MREREWRTSLRDSPVSPSAKLVGFILSTYTEGHEMTASPGRERLAEDAGKTTRTVSRCTAELITAGLIQCVSVGHSAGPNSEGYGINSTYRLTNPKEATSD